MAEDPDGDPAAPPQPTLLQQGKKYFAIVAAAAAFIATVLSILGAFGLLPTQTSDGATSPASDAPDAGQVTAVRVDEEDPGIGRGRGFVTPKGFVISYNMAFLSGRPTAVWNAGDDTAHTELQLVRRGGRESQAALLRVLGEAPASGGVRTRDAADVQTGETVSLLVESDRRLPGEALRMETVHGVPAVEGGTVTLRLLAFTSDSRPGDAGAPVVDSSGRLVGMLVAEGRAGSYAIPVAALIREFPEAF
ncbi:trypsin-like peptidase domain-containing protein [Streptomyces sp. S.PB5]|uniref:trypsin-like peptidase domain-containing protein n=1 Tax=Streptomyces sp. S.PB5 TaxID=3020844 RepID=UPI0025AED816|nr:trypsin-like peptidase domain-containing protein [Streptomyces sp. S.PB5]MDN3022693.1 hypothetical protein [Streptomyces sp. S.PB5]